MLSRNTRRSFPVLWVAYVPVVATAMAGFASPSLAQSFAGLGIPPGARSSSANAVSADGLVVVGEFSPGSSDREAFRWTAAGGLVSLGESSSAAAKAVSADGSVIVGFWSSAAFRWTTGGGMAALPMAPDTYPFPTHTSHADNAVANAISADGAVIVGNMGGTVIDLFLRWGTAWIWQGAEGGALGPLFPLGPGSDTGGYGVNANGSVVVGNAHLFYSNYYNPTVAYKWTADTGYTILTPWGSSAVAYAVTADGSVVVGYHGANAVLWTNGGVEVVLAAGNNSSALAVSSDGSVVVGSGPNGAFRWTSGEGTADLNSYLPARGIDLSGWVLSAANGISGDGRTIVGVGNHNGATEGWIVSMPCISPPAMSSQPQSETTCRSGTATFSATASGTGPITYQWQWALPVPSGEDPTWNDLALGANSINGHTAFTCSLNDPIGGRADVGNGSSGRYLFHAIATNACGSVTSDAATWTNCAVDMNCDGRVDVGDFLAFLSFYAAGDPRADVNGSGGIDVSDFLAFLSAYALGCG